MIKTMLKGNAGNLNKLMRLHFLVGYILPDVPRRLAFSNFEHLELKTLSGSLSKL